MTKVSTIISLPVLSLYEGELIGQITKLYFDKKLKKLEYVTVSCEGDLNYILSTKNIYKLGKNAVTIKNTSCLTLDFEFDFANFLATAIDSKTYTIQGEYLGKINEITIDEKFKVVDIILDNDKILDCKQLASCGKNTIIVYDNSTKISVSRFKSSFAPKILKKHSETKVETLPIEPIIEEINQEITLPTTASNNPNFIVGRIATKDILLDDKKVLIKQFSTITEKIVKLATYHNKLKELMLFSREK